MTDENQASATTDGTPAPTVKEPEAPAAPVVDPRIAKATAKIAEMEAANAARESASRKATETKRIANNEAAAVLAEKSAELEAASRRYREDTEAAASASGLSIPEMQALSLRNGRSDSSPASAPRRNS